MGCINSVDLDPHNLELNSPFELLGSNRQATNRWSLTRDKLIERCIVHSCFMESLRLRLTPCCEQALLSWARYSVVGCATEGEFLLQFHLLLPVADDAGRISL